MFPQLIFLLFIKIMCCLQPANALGSESDHLALLEFKKEITSDPRGVFQSWNDSSNFCSWYGVSCSRRHKRVTALDLSSLNLRGSMSPHIGNLTFLRLIDLGNNSFSGEIPLQVGRLFRLQLLFLLNNTFTGEIPAQLSNCSQLRVISMGQNKLVGRIPPELGSLTKLQGIGFPQNNLTGRIPPSIGNLSSLINFTVPYNNLVGSIPNDIGRMKSLSGFSVAVNKLSGTIPASFYNISSITLISAAANNLSGTIPANIAITLPNLKHFVIGGNGFSGSIPDSLSNASKLETIHLSENKFSGVVPRDLGKLKLLRMLAFGINYLGSNSTDDLDFLSSLKNNSRLKILDFSGNQFGGVLPHSITNLSRLLNFLTLGANQISGVIPSGLAIYADLYVLGMDNNLFSGVIPSSFGRFRNMQEMTLERNRLSGPIPSSFGNLTQLTRLYLLENNLSGSIPPSIGNCKNLQLLDISKNSLTGAIPKELMGLSSLQLLMDLSQNSLTGNLPEEVSNLKNVNALNFSDNNMSGEIPTAIGDCQSLEYLNLQGNSFRGVIPSTMASLKGLTYLDLSRNNLTGNISKDLQNLDFLLYFNASFNDLEGEMPTEGVFRNASAISVMGNNKLCGGVPELRLPPCPKVKSTKHGISHAMKLVIISTSVVCLLLLSTLLGLYWKRKSEKALSTVEQDLYHLPQVSYKTLYDGTRGFSPDNLLGSGSFGSVYKGILNQDEREVAIKVLNLQGRGALKSFMAECMTLRNIRHRNLVKIITSCSSIDYQGNDFKALVFEFMANSSLEEWLHPQVHSENQSRNLNFHQRLDISLDVAHALHYLHVECEPPIVHCDLKPSNVLLDNDMVAHVGDFGLARILSTTSSISQNQSSTIGLKGTVGYAAPEYGMGGKASIQGDAYSYGILLLEMFTGKRPTNEIFKEDLNIHEYVNMALPERLMQIVDLGLVLGEVEAPATASIQVENEANSQIVAQANSGENRSQMSIEMENCLRSVLEIGLACSVEPQNERMKMGEVISELLHVKSAFLGSVTNRPRRRQF